MQQHPQRNSLDVLGLQDVLSVLACEQQLQDKQQGSPVLEPFRPHDGYVRGPPKPHCHDGRVAAADGIQALRRTRDGELGECMLVVEMCTSTLTGFGGVLEVAIQQRMAFWLPVQECCSCSSCLVPAGTPPVYLGILSL
jgi:hypothetical protein